MGLQIRRRNFVSQRSLHHYHMRAHRDAVVEINDILIEQRMQPLETAWPILSGSLVPCRRR